MKPRSAADSPALFHVSRRRFLHRCALIAAASGLPAWFVERQLLSAATAPKRLSPNDRPGVALIGCGGMGVRDALGAGQYGDVVAVCDVDDERLDQAVEKLGAEGHRPARFKDFRKVLARDDVHAIVNVTPDHWHTLINVGAARAGKDIYAEKPLTLTVEEGRHVVKAVRDHDVVLQTGTQQRSSERFRMACDLVRNGRLGRLQHADVWLPAGLREGPFETAPVPTGLNWDVWLGPTPFVPYVPERCHRTFRFWYDYSGGTMTDWGAHHNDIAYWAIGLPAPTRVEATAHSQPIHGGYNAIADYEVRYTYENGIGLNIRTTKDDSIFGAVVNPEGQRNGIRFVGTEGWIWVNRNQINASDMDLLRTPLPEDAVRLPVSNDHMENFMGCVRSRALPICDVETGHLSANMCHLGTIALRTGRSLTWDYKRERFTGRHAREANRHLSRPLRKPYDYSFVG